MLHQKSRNKLKVWVDADACPGMIRDIIIKAAMSRGVETVFVANKPLSLIASPYLKIIHVAQGDDVADALIADQAQPSDVVITQDIPLAAILIEKEITVISFHGERFTKNTIGERLSVRNFMHELRGTGIQTGGPKPFSQRDKQQFANAFDRILTQGLK